MGLDVTAYAKIMKVEGITDNEDGVYYHALVHPDFPGRGDGLEDGAFYVAARRLDFRAGSYSGYNEWRNELAVRVGYGSAKNVWNMPNPQGPFVELINFADNEGDFGPAVCAKLARDFAEHEARILGAAGSTVYRTDYPEGHFADNYRRWRAAFEMGADAGAVQLH